MKWTLGSSFSPSTRASVCVMHIHSCLSSFCSAFCPYPRSLLCSSMYSKLHPSKFCSDPSSCLTLFFTEPIVSLPWVLTAPVGHTAHLGLSTMLPLSYGVASVLCHLDAESATGKDPSLNVLALHVHDVADRAIDKISWFWISDPDEMRIGAV